MCSREHSRVAKGPTLSPRRNHLWRSGGQKGGTIVDTRQVKKERRHLARFARSSSLAALVRVPRFARVELASLAGTPPAGLGASRAPAALARLQLTRTSALAAHAHLRIRNNDARSARSCHLALHAAHALSCDRCSRSPLQLMQLTLPLHSCARVAHAAHAHPRPSCPGSRRAPGRPRRPAPAQLTLRPRAPPTPPGSRCLCAHAHLQPMLHTQHMHMCACVAHAEPLASLAQRGPQVRVHINRACAQ